MEVSVKDPSNNTRGGREGEQRQIKIARNSPSHKQHVMKLTAAIDGFFKSPAGG